MRISESNNEFVSKETLSRDRDISATDCQSPVVFDDKLEDMSKAKNIIDQYKLVS